QQGDVAFQQVGAAFREVLQAVVLRLDFLGLVHDERQVAGQFRRTRQHGEGVQVHRVAAFHVDGAAAEEGVAALGVGAPAGGDVVGDGHRVQVPGEDDALTETPVRPGDDVVPHPLDRDGRELTGGVDLPGDAPDGGLHRVGDAGLVAGDAGDVDERGRQLHR